MDTDNSRDNSRTFSLTRRAFLKVSMLVTSLASAWGVVRFLSYEAPSERLLDFTTIGEPRTYPLGSAIYVREVKAWLIHDPDGFYALSATCTHLGCTINQGEGQFNCPCHGSQFTMTGSVLHGPAVSPLPCYQVRLSDSGNLVIDRRVEVPPTKRLAV